MTTGRRTWVVVGAIALLAAGLPAQESDPGAAALARARLVLERENDPRAAAAILEPLVAESGLAADLRATAHVRLAAVYGALGRAAEERQQLTLAAEGEGPDAARAREMLGRQDAQDEDPVTRQIRMAIGIFYGGTEERVNTGQTTLALIGAPAVAPLTAAIRENAVDLAFVRNAVGALVMIRGEAAAGFFRDVARSDDVRFRRAIVQGLRSGRRHPEEPVRSAVIGLARDPDDFVATHVIDEIGGALRGEEIVALLDIPSTAALPRLLGQLLRAQPEPYEYGRPDETALIPALRRVVAVGDANGVGVVRAVMKAPWFMTSWSRVAFYLDELVRTAADAGVSDLSWVQMCGSQYRPSDESGPQVDAILGAARAVMATARGRATHRDALAGFVARHAPTVWGPPELDAMLELVDLGLFAKIPRLPAKWLCLNAGPRVDDVLLRLPRLDDRAAIASWALQPQGPRPTSRSVPVVAEWIASLLAAPDEDRSELSHAAALLAGMDTEEGASRLIDLVRTEPRAWLGLATGVASAHGVTVPRILAVLLAAPDDGQGRAPSTRNDLFLQLLGSGGVVPGPYFGAAYRLGLAHRDFNQPPSGPRAMTRYRGLGGLGFLGWRTRYEPAALVEIFRICLDGDGPSAWEDALDAISVGPFGDAAGWEAVHELLCDRALGAPDEDALRTKLVAALLIHASPATERLVNRGLESEDSGVRKRVLGYLARGEIPLEPVRRARVVAHLADPDPLVVVAALEALGRRGAIASSELSPLLGHPHAMVRREALDRIPIGAADALGWLTPLLKDPEPSVRSQVCHLMARAFESRAVPPLIEMLRDPDEGVRAAAGSALDMVSQYFDQKDRWRRWADGAGLDSASAAEALLGQAAPGQPKAVRLMALASLGTLGVPETLPILIGHSGDADPEVAAAAVAAVAAINRR